MTSLNARRTGAILTLALLLLVVLVPAQALAFSDVSVSHEYAQGIRDLSARGIINGYPDGTFRPNAPVLRAQFAKMAAGVFGLNVHQGLVCTFIDMGQNNPNDFYPHQFVAAANAAGITRR